MERSLVKGQMGRYHIAALHQVVQGVRKFDPIRELRLVHKFIIDKDLHLKPKMSNLDGLHTNGPNANRTKDLAAGFVSFYTVTALPIPFADFPVKL